MNILLSMVKEQKIRDMQGCDKPREKMAKHGPRRLNNKELLCVLFGSGIKNKDVMEISKDVEKEIERIIDSSLISKGEVQSDHFPSERFEGIPGISKVRGQIVAAAIEYGKRVHDERTRKIKTPAPKEVWESLPEIRKSKKEHFIIIMLDSRGREIDRDIISIGTINASLVHPREVFRPVIKNSAVSIIAVHNHPSGTCEPSNADIHITKQLIEAGEILGIEFEDHIIVSKEHYYSFLENMSELFE